ncbi:tetratricopeptide repeat protein [Mucilaginibacter paludis]|nr:hypothetical protein [Mucilaginibacter paludis]
MIPKLLLIALLFTLFYQISPDLGVLYGSITYLLIIYLVRYFIPLSMRKGVSLIKHNKFDEAIPYFRRSVQFFTQYAWLDQYRSITILSSSRYTYKEMSMCNEAFSLSQINRGAEAKQIYEEVLAQYPQNNIAATALRMMESDS